ncbi:efflux RND transporter periplasmic adaptor subunit [Caulobacter segnis]|uniref:efflux RND transporter periplasmic adaptor subunit n=1 Tax=Caulobacter segnis TaxID=88688 RepID=UPI0026CB0355|nr:efflux RND transporter periplasmic adaptor subunit [Caulobacter segnis]
MLAVGAVVILTGCGPQKTPAPPYRTVEAIVAAPATGSLRSVYSGQVVARYSIQYGFRVPGQIASRPVEIGQTVAAGQVLASLDPKDLAANARGAAAQTSAADAQANAQSADLQRARSLLAQGFISKAEFDQTQAAAKGAQAQLRAAQAQQTGAGQQLSYSSLRAVRAGVVTAVAGEAGQVVAAGQPVVTVDTPGELEIAVSVPEGEVSAFRGASLGVRLWNSSQVFPGQVRTLSAAANPQTRTFDARVAFKPPPGVAAIGGTAEVIVQQSAADGATLRVPLAAVTERDGHSVVWVISGQPQRVQPRIVTIKAMQDNAVLLAGGLAPGERIVSAGAHLMRPGQAVTAVSSSAERDQ